MFVRKENMIAQQQWPVSVYDYDIKEEIGRGGSSVVFRAISKSYQMEVAVKQIDLEESKTLFETIRVACRVANMRFVFASARCLFVCACVRARRQARVDDARSTARARCTV